MTTNPGSSRPWADFSSWPVVSAARLTVLLAMNVGWVGPALAATATTTTLGVVPAVMTVGQGLTLKATVVKPTAGYAPGSVVFKDGTTTLKAVSLSNGNASLALPVFTASGSHSYSVAYTSSSWLIAGSTSAAQTVAVKYATTTSLSATPATARAGQPISLVAKVTGGSPAGTVTFKDGALELGTVTVSAGQASLNKSPATEGAHNFTASYSGDAATLNSASNTATAQLTGRDYFVATGPGSSDANNGSYFSPWATLAKVATLKLINRADIASKQGVKLQCGGEWREQLTLGAANVADVTKDVFELGQWGVCLSTNRPLINSAVQLRSGAGRWQKVSGSIYQYTFNPGEIPANVTQLFIRNGSSFVQLQEARHPNAGFLTIPGNARPTWPQAAESHNDILKSSAVDHAFLRSQGVDSLKGAQVHVRTAPYAFEDRTVKSYVDSSDGSGGGILTFGALPYDKTNTEPVGYGATAGYGYVLTGKDWMIDAPGEWSYDPATLTLKLWAPASLDPNTLTLEASVREHGIFATDVPVKVSDVAVRLSALEGISVNGGPASVINNVDVAYSGRNGVALDIEPYGTASSAGTTISNSKVAFSRDSGIITGWSLSQVSVLNNTVTDTGNYLEPHHSLVGIGVSAGGTGRSFIQGNTVLRTAYNGIGFTSTSLSADANDQASKTQVTGNVVEDFCQRLDDCGGIYTYNGNGLLNINTRQGAVVANNVVRRGQGDLSGSSETRLTGVTGLYMDDDTQNIYLHDNVVSDTEIGIVLHNNGNDRVEKNSVLAVRSDCLVLDNSRVPAANLTIANNTCVAGGTYTSPPTTGEDLRFSQRTATAVTLLSDSTHPITTFGTVYKFSDNTYASLYGGSLFRFEESYQSNLRNLNLQGWSQVAEPNLLGSDANTPLLSPYRVTRLYGSNLVANGDMSADPSSATLVGWDNSSSVKPELAVNCGSAPASPCATRVSDPADSRRTISVSRSAPIPLTPGLTYEVAMRVRTPNGPTRLTWGLGSPCFASVWAYLMVPSSGWATVRAPFVATSQLGYPDNPSSCQWGNQSALGLDATNANNQIVPLMWDDVSVQQVDVSYGTTPDDYRVLVNTADTDQAQACPDGASSPRCAQYVGLDRKAVAWPLTVPAHGAKIVVWSGSAFYNAQ
jgi:parallel beta-helix repeat protein